MPTIRFAALQQTMNRHPLEYEPEHQRVSEVFGKHVFNKKAMSEYITGAAYKNVVDAMEKGTKISREIADQVASGMKSWALSNGATHYTHWFQPLNRSYCRKA